MFKNDHSFYMYGKIKFNNEIKETDDISLGSFEAIINDKQTYFDFLTFKANIDEKDESILHFELYEIDKDFTCCSTVYNDDKIDEERTQKELLNAKRLEISEFCQFGIATFDENLDIEEVLELYICNKNGEFKVPIKALLSIKENIDYMDVV